MTKRREIGFTLIRGFLAILIALLVATLLIFISAEGEGIGKSWRPPGKLSSSCLSGRCSVWAKTAPALS